MMRTHLGRGVSCALLAAFCVAAAGAGLARASTSTPKLDGIFRKARCSADPCDPDRDPKVAPHAVVGSVVQLQVSASAQLGLEWVRVEAQIEGNPRWLCIQQWAPTGSLSYSGVYDWDTSRWPKPGPGWGCRETSPHFHGEPTSNLPHLVRVTAQEQGSRDRVSSDGFPIVLSNVPGAPAWSAAPKVTGLEDGRPSVFFAFGANREPDIVEYDVVRTGPGSPKTIAVAATNPKGCRLIERFECHDSGFARTGGGGTYGYRVYALRLAADGSTRCSLTGKRCVRSAASPSKSVLVTIKAATAAARTTPSASASASPSGAPNSAASTGTVTNSGSGATVAAAPAGTHTTGSSRWPREVLVFLATVMLLALAWRVLPAQIAAARARLRGTR